MIEAPDQAGQYGNHKFPASQLLHLRVPLSQQKIAMQVEALEITMRLDALLI